MSVHVCIDSGKLVFQLLQRFDNNTETFPVLRAREVKTVTFCHRHRNQLMASHYHRSEDLTLLIWQRPDKTFPLQMSVDAAFSGRAAQSGAGNQYRRNQLNHRGHSSGGGLRAGAQCVFRSAQRADQPTNPASQPSIDDPACQVPRTASTCI